MFGFSLFAMSIIFVLLRGNMFTPKNIDSKQEAIELITLFGITAEELLEAGASYEDVVSFGGIIK